MTTLSPSQIAMQCNCLALRRAARSVARLYDEALRPLDLTNGQFSMLAAIAGLGSANTQAIAELLGMDRTTVTAALKPLQRRSLVEVAVADDDQRGRVVTLTRRGERLFEQAVPLWQTVQASVARGLGGATASAALRRQLVSLD